MAETLEVQLMNLEEEKDKIRERIKERDKKRKIECASCESYHKIEELTAIQTHWYHEPHGCAEGDYWSEGELQFVCPTTNVRNRLLFDDDDLPWEERKDGNPTEKQFRYRYGSLFREVKEEHENDSFHSRGKYKFVNNYYVDKNRKKFGLREKKE